MAEDKKKKNPLWSRMKKVTNTKGKNNPVKNQTDYKTYLMGGGGSDFKTWKQENNRN